MLKNHNIFVQKSPVHGWGVFTREDLGVDEVVEECPYLPISDEAKMLDKSLRSYAFSSQVGPAILLGYGGIYNHSPEPNVAHEQIDNHFVFRTLREVRAGEELFHDYGDFHLYEDFESGRPAATMTLLSLRHAVEGKISIVHLQN